MIYPTLARFRHFSSLFTNLPSTLVEIALQISPFYAKQSQSQVRQNQHKLFCDKYIRVFRLMVIQTNKANQTQFQTSDIRLQFSDEAQILMKFIDSCNTKTSSKTDGNEVDIYTMLCHYIKHLICFLTSEVVRRRNFGSASRITPTPVRIRKEKL